MREWWELKGTMVGMWVIIAAAAGFCAAPIVF